MSDTDEGLADPRPASAPEAITPHGAIDTGGRGEASSALLSIAVLTRNRRDDVERCLTGIADQARAAGVGMVLLVNGSSDDSAAHIRGRFPDIEVHETSMNLGCPGGRNRLMDLCSTTWVAFVDDDATITRGFVETLEREIRSAPADRMVIAGNIIDPDLNPEVRFMSGPTTRFSGGVCAIRRKEFLQLGGYPEFGLRQGEEGALSIRLHAAGLHIHRSGDLVILHPLRLSPDKRREAIRTGVRQAVLTGVTTCPWWLVPGWIAWKVLAHAAVAVRTGAVLPWLGGIGDAMRDVPRALRQRRPVPARAVFAASSRFGARRG